MSRLWQRIGLAVLDGEHDPSEVARAIPVATTLIETAPQRHALSARIHDQGGEEPNARRFAVFSTAGRTFVAPPSAVATYTGETHWQQALAKRFGTVHWFSIFDAAPSWSRFESGAQAERHDAQTEDEVLIALARLLGVDDARTTLSVPGGKAFLYDAERGRW